MVAKAEVNLNWLWTIGLIIDSFGCVFISAKDLAQPIWCQYQCSHCFHDFSTATPAPRVRRAWNLMGTSVRNGRRFFLLFGKKNYFIEKLYIFLLITFFGNVFQSSRIIGLIMLLYVKLRCQKSIKDVSWKTSWGGLLKDVFKTFPERRLKKSRRDFHFRPI